MSERVTAKFEERVHSVLSSWSVTGKVGTSPIKAGGRPFVEELLARVTEKKNTDVAAAGDFLAQVYSPGLVC